MVRSSLGRLAGGIVALALLTPPAAHPEDLSLNDLKARVWDAQLVARNYAAAMKFCSQLDGTNFYFLPRNRVLNLEEYHRSLENLVKEGSVNPETRMPWSEQDAAARWEKVKAQALKDKANCEMVARLPQLEKQLEQMEKSTDSSHIQN